MVADIGAGRKNSDLSAPVASGSGQVFTTQDLINGIPSTNPNDASVGPGRAQPAAGAAAKDAQGDTEMAPPPVKKKVNRQRLRYVLKGS